jgi:hypothetical protein
MSDLGSALIAQLDDDALAELATRLAPFLPRPDSADDAGWLCTREAAKYLGITANALHKLTAARAIPFEQEGPNAQYYGATIARDRAAHRLVIFQDTLERDFGSDPDLLPPGRAHPAPRGRTHLGYNEPGVAALGF